VSEAHDGPAATARILVVEDEVLIQMLAAENLEDLGFKAEIAGSAAAAKSLVASLEGDVAAAIVDMGLPDATGDVLVSELRAIYPKLPIVVSSGQSEASLLDRFKGHELVGFLTKPYAMEQLERALRSIGVLA
jgi:DNA-binding response OmpR family regulator